MDSIKPKEPLEALKDMFIAFGVRRRCGYFLVFISTIIITCLFGLRGEAGNVDGYLQYLGVAVGFSFAAYSFVVNLNNTHDRLTQKADNGKYPLEELFAVFTCSIFLHLLAMAVLTIFNCTGCIIIWYIFLGLLLVCLYSLGDIGLNFYTLHTFFRNIEMRKNEYNNMTTTEAIREKKDEGEKKTNCFCLFLSAIIALFIAFAFYLIGNSYKEQLKSDIDKRIEVILQDMDRK